MALESMEKSHLIYLIYLDVVTLCHAIYTCPMVLAMGI